MLFLKTLQLAESWRDGSSLFHSMMVDEKNMFLNKLCLKRKEGVLVNVPCWTLLFMKANTPYNIMISD